MTRFDFGRITEAIERRSPLLAKKFAAKVVSIVTPFNGHLKMRILTWSKTVAVAEIDRHRGVRNHLGGIHAGALFTLGESVAGLLILKNFSFKEFRMIMTEAGIKYEKQARGKVKATAKLDPKVVGRLKKTVADEPAFIKMQTDLENESGEYVACLKTTWQVKRWADVRKSGAGRVKK